MAYEDHGESARAGAREGRRAIVLPISLSARFGRPARDKFAGLAVGEGLGGAPVLDGVAALFECRAGQRHEGGDHLIIVGHVERYRRSDRAPLLFHAGRYCAVVRPDAIPNT